MANQKIEPRLPNVMHQYLDDLAALGAYGGNKTDVAKTFIEQGIQMALREKLIQPRKPEKKD